jgi:hypothetical protein
LPFIANGVTETSLPMRIVSPTRRVSMSIAVPPF